MRTYGQLQPLLVAAGRSLGWNQIGITPMLGVNLPDHLQTFSGRIATP